MGSWAIPLLPHQHPSSPVSTLKFRGIANLGHSGCREEIWGSKFAKLDAVSSKWYDKMDEFPGQTKWNPERNEKGRWLMEGRAASSAAFLASRQCSSANFRECLCTFREFWIQFLLSFTTSSLAGYLKATGKNTKSVVQSWTLRVYANIIQEPSEPPHYSTEIHKILNQLTFTHKIH